MVGSVTFNDSTCDRWGKKPKQTEKLIPKSRSRVKAHLFYISLFTLRA